ncbi:endonuclease domain-containing protein [Nitratireductor thuwali]|uniref:endonuclease domain-containing protein n=1 Tax=Nitratireductor thuwali TaxID=2267699 RepID=UPI0030CBF3B1
MRHGRPPLRSASRTTSPPLDGGEEEPAATSGTLPLPPAGGEVARRDGVGEDAADTRSRRKAGVTKRARQLRQTDNEAEALLWLELKRRRLGGFKFTRQFPIGPFFADFACRERWLVVEVDGSQHIESAHDRRRDEFMRSHGYSVLRFGNVDVLQQRSTVCETILAALEGRIAEDVSAPDLRFIHAPTSISGTDISK